MMRSTSRPAILPSILRRLPLLRVVGNKLGTVITVPGLRDFLAKIGLGVGLQLAKYERCNLLRGESLGFVANLHLHVGVAIFAFNNLQVEREVLRRLLAHFREFAAKSAAWRKKSCSWDSSRLGAWPPDR